MRVKAEKGVRRFRLAVYSLLQGIETAFPGFVPDDAGPEPLDFPRQPIRDAIDGILGSFDHLQEDLGLNPDEEYPRHRRVARK